ncbi:hypothetical protein GCM10025858_16800 [Alicyclobacillus sacchari]|nr:hypothetical protein GCM10025858_16800 [Alicyclobacillus sacchari]
MDGTFCAIDACPLLSEMTWANMGAPNHMMRNAQMLKTNSDLIVTR